MPLVNKKPFQPAPIPEVSSPDEEVFYLSITNEIFKSHDEFFDRFLYCNSLIWTCSRTGKSGLTYAEALESEQQGQKKKKGGKRPRSTQDAGAEGDEAPVKKKKKKYPYDPKKYSMPVPEGFDPSLLTPTGKIDGRKLKSKKNKLLADELLAASTTISATAQPEDKPKKGKHKKKEDEAKKKEDEVKRKEEEAKKKAQMQAELAKEREFEAKRKKEAAALAKQLEKQKKEEERKRATAFLQNWEKKCEDLERDDLRRLPAPTPLNCDIPEKLFGDAIFILESLYNLHDLYNIQAVFPDGISYDTLEEMLIDRQEDGPLGTVLQFLLRLIFDKQPTGEGYGLDDDPSKSATASDLKQENNKIVVSVKSEASNGDAEIEGDHDQENSLGSDTDEEDEENVDKDVKMNDLIGSAIKAAQEIRKSLVKPLPEMELNSTNVTEILRLHLLQSGSFPKGRTIYNGWYSSREDPGLWLCMQEPDLIKKLGEVTVYDLEIEEKIKILHTLIYQLFSFIRTRLYIESASDTLTELRKNYRHHSAAFARWDRENCVKRLQPPKRKCEQNSNSNLDTKSNGVGDNSDHIKSEQNQMSNPGSINGDINDSEYESGLQHSNKESNNNQQQLKSCLKPNGTSLPDAQAHDNDETGHSKKKITFKTGMNGAIEENGTENCEANEQDISYERNANNGLQQTETDQTYEELREAFLQNMTDYEDYQRERAHRLEELNENLIEIRDALRKTQSVYGVHPIGRDRAYRRYWIFQSLPGLFVEQDDEYVGKCLPQPTPLESRYKKLFNKENPLMHPNEADLIRTKTCDVACSTDMSPIRDELDKTREVQQSSTNSESLENRKELDSHDENPSASITYSAQERLNGSENPDEQEDPQEGGDFTSDEMNYCTGDETSCAIHGQKRPTQTRWWFYHAPDSIENLIECLNKRGIRENELHDVLHAEISIIKPRIAECPALKLNKYLFGQAGIRRSRRLRTKGSKKRSRRHADD